MKLAIEVEPYRRRLAKPLVTSRGELAERAGFFVRLVDRDGHVGWGEAAPVYWIDDDPLDATGASLGPLHGRSVDVDALEDQKMNSGSQDDILDADYQIILDRKYHPTEHSYVAALYAKGLDKILGKIGEESTEVAVAGKGGDPEQVVCEAADLLFRLLVLLGHYNLPPERVYAELRRRFGTSGLVEKANRQG